VLVVVILVLAFMYMRATRKKGSARPGMLSIAFLVFAMIVLLAGQVHSQDITAGLSVVDKNLNPGDEAKAVLSITNKNYTGYRTDVFARYSLLDPAGNLIKSESGTFPVSDSRDIVLKLTVPQGSSPGAYSFMVYMEHPQGSDTYTDSFRVEGPADYSVLYALTPLIIGAVFVMVFISRRKR